MLYPKKCTIRKRKFLREGLIYIKECFIVLLKAFSSYSSFLIFMEQKFHF